MSVPKGRNGKQAGKEHLEAVQRWVSERERLRDWHEYERAGKINRTALATELGFDRGVVKDNPGVKELVQEKDRLWFGSSSAKKKEAQEASLERTSAALSKASADNNKLVSRIAALEAENRELRRENVAFKRIQSMIESGDPGFRV